MATSTDNANSFDVRNLLLIGLLPFLSGAAALSHELLWTRRLIDILGATDWVVGRVLGIFFLGISIGAYLATRFVREDVSSAKQLAIAECSIAILALPAVFLTSWTDWIWPALGTELLVSWTGASIKLLIGFAAVLPPSIAMGFTLPLFIRTATERTGDVASVGVWIYALNTLGGVFGLWLTSTRLLEWFGALQTMLLAVGLNVLLAVAIWIVTVSFSQLSPANQKKKRLRKKRKKKLSVKNGGESLVENASAEQVAAASRQNITRPKLISLSFASGFIVLALEVLLLRLVYLVVPSSFHSTSALLANVILFLALSSIVISLSSVSRVTSKLVTSRGFLFTSFAITALLTCLCPIILFNWTDKLMSIRYLEGLNGRTIDSIGHYWFLVFGLVAASGGLALISAGFVFPTIMKLSSLQDPKGTKIGILFAVNGFGGLAGSEFSNMILIGWVGLYQAFAVLASVIIFLAALLLIRTNRVSQGVVTVAVIISVLVTNSFNRELPYVSPRSVTKFVVQEVVCEREGVFVVVENEEKSKSILVNGQYVLGSSGVAADQRRQLTLPWILHPEANSVCSLGLATGISASGLQQLPGPPPVTAIEISHTVANLSRQFFNEETNGFFDQTNNKVVIEDARTFMAASKDQFDLIIGDLYRPHGAGEGRLFSIEHFRNVKGALKQDGLFCQWLPAYQLDFETWKTIAATFDTVFSETLIIYGNEDSSYPVIGLVGRNSDRKWTAKELGFRFKNIPQQLLDKDPLLNKAGKLVVGTLRKEFYSDAPLNRLDNLQVELSAGKFWILKDLRKNRAGDQFKSDFIRRQNLPEFNRRLKSATTKILSKDG